jgi:hypothetical protein
MSVTIKNAVFWDVMLCGSCKNNVSEERIASVIKVTRIGKHHPDDGGNMLL